MKIIRALTLLVTSLMVSHNAYADVLEISNLSPNSKVFSMFAIKDPRKTSVAKAKADLVRFLSPLNMIPCLVGSDRGSTISCTDGAVTISTSHLYTYNLHLSFDTVVNQLKAIDPKRYKGVKLPDGVTDAWGVNFIPPPTNGSPCIGACNQTGPVTLNFNVPASEFGVDIDNGPTTVLTQEMRIIVNGQEYIKALPLGVTHLRLQNIEPISGTVNPIYSVILDPIGGATGAYILDRISYTPMQ